jgi:hypothetical protein
LQVRSFALWGRIAAVFFIAGFCTWLVAVRSSKAQGPSSVPAAETGVFTTEHRSVGDAVREFFGVRSTPVQPIAFTHQVHLANQLECTYCHVGVDQGPEAKIPGTAFCMTCHIAIDTDKPEIKKIAAYQARGEDIPWVRVYNYSDSAHVRFNHAAHIHAGVGCATCHGDMTKQTTAERKVDLNMGFCVNCHKQKQVSVDCETCHF